LFNTFSFRKV